MACVSKKIIEKAPSDHFRLLCKPRERASVTTDHVYAMLSVNFLDEHTLVENSELLISPKYINIFNQESV